MPGLVGKIIYSCPFVPAEWIRAHGFAPSRVVPPISGSGVSATGVCPYCAAFTDLAASGGDWSAVVVTTACDQMRHAAEIVSDRSSAPVFTMNVPHTWQSPGSHRLYRQELERLGGFLIGLGGIAPSPGQLSDVMVSYDAARAAIRDSRPKLTARRHSELIAEFHRAPDAFPGVTCPTVPSTSSGCVSVALIGGPLVREAYILFDLIERAGGYVALDATETGERTLPAPFDRRRLREDPLGVLCDSYFGTIPDPMRRPNSEFFRWLGEKIPARGIRGLIVLHHLWCDNWRAEIRRIADWSGLPILQLDVGDGGLDENRARLRLDAFFEVVK